MKFAIVLLMFCVTVKMLDAQAPIEIQKHYEFEDALRQDQDGMWVWRSEASELKTLRIEDQEGLSRVKFTLCVEPYNATQNITLYVDDIRYSNDGPSDNITLIFNGIAFAKFQTLEKWRSGHEWNVFRNSGNLGPALNLRPGRYDLLVTVVTDYWGVEFDRIRINAENQDPNIDLFCGSSVFYVAP